MEVWSGRIRDRHVVSIQAARPGPPPPGQSQRAKRALGAGTESFGQLERLDRLKHLEQLVSWNVWNRWNRELTPVAVPIFPTPMPLDLNFKSVRTNSESSVQGTLMKKDLKRKNYYLDEKKIRRVKTILGAKTETEAIDAALSLVVFRKEILKSLEKVAGKGGVEKVF